MNLESEDSRLGRFVAFVDKLRRFDVVNVFRKTISARFDSVRIPARHMNRFGDLLRVPESLDRLNAVFIEGRLLAAPRDDLAECFAVENPHNIAGTDIGLIAVEAEIARVVFPGAIFNSAIAAVNTEIDEQGKIADHGLALPDEIHAVRNGGLGRRTSSNAGPGKDCSA